MTPARIRGPAGSNSCLLRFRAVSEGPRVRVDFPDDSGSGSMARRVDRLSRANRAHAWGLTVSTRCPGGLVPGTEGLGVDLLFLETRARSLGPAGTTICPGDSGPCPRAHRDDQLSWEARDCVGGPAALTSLPGHLRPEPEGPQCPTALLGDSDRTRGHGSRTAVPGDSCCGPSYRGVNLLSWATRASARGPTVSSNSPRRLEFWSEVPQLTSCP